MRCWRILSASKPCDFAHKDEEHQNTKFELSFEYLMSDGELRWITILSPQAILMSVCLQSIVVELLRIRNNDNLNNKVSLSFECII